MANVVLPTPPLPDEMGMIRLMDSVYPERRGGSVVLALQWRG
jgi:hypothetical protein